VIAVVTSLWCLQIAMAEKGLAAPGPSSRDGDGNSQNVSEDVLRRAEADPDLVKEGAKIFAHTCAVCHGNEGQGRVGPNLTDDDWIHGGKPSEIYAVVAAGVPSKGMPAWFPTLGATNCLAVTAFVLTRRGLHLPGKPPQGEPIPLSK
jgi:cytochrome c oxidase cbb3-type subunit III